LRLNAYHLALVRRGESPNPKGDFCLPTEAQWEYACRAGSTTDYSFGNSERELRQYAWFSPAEDRPWYVGDQVRPAGQKKPNAWGLYDMHGNVWQWCADRYSEDSYEGRPDPFAAVAPYGSPEPASSHARVVRGGAFNCPAGALRSSFRLWSPEGSPPCIAVGVRVAMTVPDEAAAPPAKAEGPKSERAESREVKK
jgi:formylglycine-generating enzyme required for sulfatase activity